VPALKFRESRLLGGKFLKDGVFRAHHRHILSSGCERARSDECGDRSRASVCDFVGADQIPIPMPARAIQGV